MKTSAYRDGTLKTNQTRWKWHHIIVSHHPYILCYFANYMHSKKLSACRLAYSYPRNECIELHTNKALSTAHSTAFDIQENPYVPCSAATKFHNNWHSNMSYRHWLSPPQPCIQDRPHLPCSVAIRLQSPTKWPLHPHINALHTHGAASFHNPPMHMHN